MNTSASLSRRQFLYLAGGLVGFGCCACAAPVTERPVAAGPLTSGEPKQTYAGLLIDSHSHVGGQHGYGEDALIRVMDQAEIARIVAFGAHPKKDAGGRIIPIAYVGSEGPDADMRAQLKDGAFRGMKTVVRHFPFPMRPAGVYGVATQAPFRAAAEIAAETKRPFTMHLDGPQSEDLAALCREFREAPIIWAHAGTTPARFGGGATARQVRDMLDSHPNLHIDLSGRADGWMGPIAFPEWEGVFLAHPRQILFGIDVFMPRFFPLVASAVRYWREVLGQFPLAVAEQAAYKNAERLFLV